MNTRLQEVNVKKEAIAAEAYSVISPVVQA